MYTRILIPLDGSSLAEQVLPYGRFLGRALRIPVHLLRVAAENEISLPAEADQRFRSGKLPLQWASSSGAYLEAIARSFVAAPVSWSVEKGNPPAVIIENASADRNTLVVMATHGGSGVRRWLLGSVTQQLLQDSINDMFVIRVTDQGRTDGEAMPTTAILPLDGSLFAEQIVPRMEELAETIGLKLILLRVAAWQSAAPDRPSSPSIDRCFHQLESELHQYLGAKILELRKKGLADVEAAVGFGYAPEEIIRTARETRNSFVALRTHRGSGLNRWALGSVTNAVVRRSRGPVLVLRGEPTRATDHGSNLLQSSSITKQECHLR